MALSVVKLGGSLLLDAKLPPAFRAWLSRRNDERCLVIFGGGGLADAIRQVDQIHLLTPETAHWLAVDAMRVTARIGHALFPELPLLENWEDVVAWRDDKTLGHAIWDASSFLRREEPTLTGSPLPLGWHVTSDSIAARAAFVLGKAPLYLLKSAPALEPNTRRHEARMGRVDLYFPDAADELPRVLYENLRDPTSRMVELARC